MRHPLALVVAVVTVVGSLAAAPRALAAPARQTDGEPEVVSESARLRQEIAALRLDRLLNLDKDQARRILPLLQEALQLQRQRELDRQKREPALVEALTAVRDDLRRDGQVSDTSRKNLREVRAAARTGPSRPRLAELRAQVRDALSPEQRQALRKRSEASADRNESVRPDGRKARAEPNLSSTDKGRGKKDRKQGQTGRRASLKAAFAPEFVALVEARAR